MQFLRSGKELVVVRLDCLGRFTGDVFNLVHEFDQRVASLRLPEPDFTTSGNIGRMVI
ncbi:recombinase family protein [Rhizobium sp.]|jgi:DNA invertase Pin-like site-specific DNA recombinase|uniref:recombinase family protein n=1 Tax=Rhizobium sp. TaxID=391 RepID=UPI002AA876F9